MKKIVFCDIPLKKESDLYSHVYSSPGNSSLCGNAKVIFPINALLAESLSNDDELKVVLLKKNDTNGNSGRNIGLFMQELDNINIGIGASLSYEIIDSPFEETRDTHEKLFRQMISMLESGAELLADITYGPKPLPLVIFCVLAFGEKFFDATIASVVYGKVDFIADEATGKDVPKNPVLYDLTSLYYLNSLTNSMECRSGREAIDMIDSFFRI